MQVLRGAYSACRADVLFSVVFGANSIGCYNLTEASLGTLKSTLYEENLYQLRPITLELSGLDSAL
jgi:hypothetical protein